MPLISVPCVTLFGALLISFATTAGEPLHILLTNDDGIEAPGIKAVEQALREAGHRLSIVAPRDQQSATSMKVTTKKLGFEKLGPQRWAVDGSPADSVAVALEVFLAEDLPELLSPALILVKT